LVGGARDIIMHKAGDRAAISRAVSKFDAMIVEDIENDKIFDGLVFSVSKRLSIALSSTNDIVIDPTACTCTDLVFLPIVFKAYGAGPINIDMYVGVNSDADGTLWASGNRDNKSSITADLTVRLNPTINSVGVKLPFEFVILSNGTAAVATAGGESKEALIFLPRKDVKYMFRIVNTEANDAAGHVSINWFEVP